MKRNKWLNQSRKCQKAQSKDLTMENALVVRVEVTIRKINKNRRASFKAELTDGTQTVVALIPSTLRARSMAELREGEHICAQLQRFSPDYRRAGNEYELINF